MLVSSCNNDKIKELTKKSTFNLKIGRYTVNLSTTISTVHAGISLLYKDYSISSNHFSDFHVNINRVSGIRGLLYPQVEFNVNGSIPFSPLPYGQALPLLEWGLNWCLNSNVNNYLVIHAAVVEKNGKVVILPGSPGSGKSTLCAAMVHEGWRLLSDELTIVSLNKPSIISNPRPVSLKNQSIDIIQKRYPNSIFSPSVHDTVKGTVSLMRAPTESVIQGEQSALPGLIIFPKFTKDATMQTNRVSKGVAMMRLIEQSFNYSILGEVGFKTLANLVDASECYEIFYDGNLDRGLQQVDDLFNYMDM